MNLSRRQSEEDATKAQIQKYISNPDTRVLINFNDDAGVWQYSVQVVGNGCWLDSFETEDEAKQFISAHGLVMSTRLG